MNTADSPYFIVNVEGVVLHQDRYLMIIRGPEETHAAGTLAFPGGKVEYDTISNGPLEATVQREILEETGITVGADCTLIENKIFSLEGGSPCLDVVFLCSYATGKPTIADPGEVAEILWLTAPEILAHPMAPVWTKESIAIAEDYRTAQSR